MADTAPSVVDNTDAKQFEITVDGHTAVLRYERQPNALVLIHTEVPPELRGRHLGDMLARAGIDAAHRTGRTLIVICPFVKAYLRKHPEVKAEFVD